ncbi:MAG: 2-oxo acid dehydrogenase subunit E2, partial [Nevskia sp.]|nr:2-oxo acid dehydrogenase subunit E2 [Nevskia sp.]
MAQFIFKLPDIGEGITEAEIATWRVAVGETVKEDQPLVDVLTEKAAVEIPSPKPGRVLELRGNPGDFAPVGSALVVLEVAGDAGSEAEEAEAAPAPAASAPAAPVAKPAPAPAKAAPAAAASAPAVAP